MNTKHLSSFPRNLRCFAANRNMSRTTRFLCYFLGLKFASVLFFTLFPSLHGINPIIPLVGCRRLASVAATTGSTWLAINVKKNQYKERLSIDFSMKFFSLHRPALGRPGLDGSS